MDNDFCPFKVREILKCAKPTAFHEVGELVVVARTDRLYATDARPYWVALEGKPGHYDWHSFELATVPEIAAALQRT